MTKIAQVDQARVNSIIFFCLLFDSKHVNPRSESKKEVVRGLCLSARVKMGPDWDASDKHGKAE